MAIRIKTQREIDVLRECGRRLAYILSELANAVRPGISTADLNHLAEASIERAGGVPVFKGYVVENSPPYPAAICTSVNDEVVHAIPRDNAILREGDIVGIDIGMAWPKNQAKEFPQYIGNPLVTDAACTIGVGTVTPELARLIQKTEEAFFIGVKEAKLGNRVGDISAAIEAFLSASGLGIVRGLAGHGVGYDIHEDPLIPNYGAAATGARLKPGMVIAIEPMATLGGGDIRLDRDGWTFRTADGSPAAHFEHTVVLTDDGAEILTMI